MRKRSARRSSVIAWCAALVIVILLIMGRQERTVMDVVGSPETSRPDRTPIPASVPSVDPAVHQVPMPEAQAQVHTVSALKRSAQAGDAAAMRQLAGIGARCVGMGYARSRFDSTVDSVSANLARGDQVTAAQYRAAAGRLKLQCDALRLAPDQMQAIAHQWRRQAAEAGDLSARIIERTATGRGEAVTGLLDEALAGGDGEALKEMGVLLSSLLVKEIDPDVGMKLSEQDAYAVSLLACERGLECGPESAMADEMCLSGLVCNGRGYDEEVRENLRMRGEMQRTEVRMDMFRGL